MADLNATFEGRRRPSPKPQRAPGQRHAIEDLCPVQSRPLRATTPRRSPGFFRHRGPCQSGRPGDKLKGTAADAAQQQYIDLIAALE